MDEPQSSKHVVAVHLAINTMTLVVSTFTAYYKCTISLFQALALADYNGLSER